MRNLTLVFMLFLMQVALASCAQAEQVVFIPGDACFTGLVTSDSDFLTGTAALNAVTNFGSATSMQDRIGVRLDLREMPIVQLNSIRQSVFDLFRVTGSKAAIICICHPDFDFKNLWLGVPYNSTTRYRLQPGDIGGDDLGPPGAIAVALRDFKEVPALPVQVVSQEQLELSGMASVAVMPLSDVVSQRNRTVIKPDGSITQIEFNYDPKERIGFDSGDSFFIANANPLLMSESNTIELEYYFLPRRLPTSIGDGSGKFIVVEESVHKTHTSELPLRHRGQHLVLHEVSEHLRSIMRERLSKVSVYQWYVFVLDCHYDPHSHRLGIRYNRVKHATKEGLLSYEYADSNYRPFMHPVGNLDDAWPPKLPGLWNGENFEVNVKDTSLVFVQYPAGLPFYSDGKVSRGLQFHVHRGEVIEIRNGNTLIETVTLPERSQ